MWPNFSNAQDQEIYKPKGRNKINHRNGSRDQHQTSVVRMNLTCFTFLSEIPNSNFWINFAIHRDGSRDQRQTGVAQKNLTCFAFMSEIPNGNFWVQFRSRSINFFG